MSSSWRAPRATGTWHRRPQRRTGRIELRFAAPSDGNAIARLAALDSKPRPTRPTLLAEVDGEVVAAAPLEGGEAIADPFTPTREVVELLEQHARTLRRAA